MRNNVGGWIKGFSKGYPWTTNNHMELLALEKGLELVEEFHLTLVEINIDSLEVLYMLSTYNLLYNEIINDCKFKTKKTRKFDGVPLL